MTNSINLAEALQEIKDGHADIYISAFCVGVLRSIASGNNEIDIDCAVVAATILNKLAYETAEGRKLLKLPKRKNYRREYCADEYHILSKEAEIAGRFYMGKLTHEQAIGELLHLHPEADEKVTLPRFLQDLCNLTARRSCEFVEIFDALDQEALRSTKDSFLLATEKLFRVRRE